MTLDQGRTDPEEIELSKLQIQIEAIALKLKGRPRNCLKNAFKRIRKAWILKKIDQEMAVFSAITGEEEAATALISALKLQKYPNSEMLNYWKHSHKAGITPMVGAVAKVFNECEFPPLTFHFEPTKLIPRINVMVRYQDMGIEKSGALAPDEPLNMNIFLKGSSKLYDFEEQLQLLASDNNIAEILDYINKQANVRNEVLYANEQGVPGASVDDKYFKDILMRISIFAALTVMIMQTKQIQLLADQVLQAYLKTLKKISI